MPEGSLASALLESRVIAVVRVDASEAIVPTAHAIARGGVRLLEVALTSPGALAAISRLAAELPDALVGAGTVLNERDAEAAVAAGARFLFSPGFSGDVLRFARSRDVFYVPGALTPTEIMELLELGVREIKIFPAGPVPYPVVTAINFITSSAISAGLALGLPCWLSVVSAMRPFDSFFCKFASTKSDISISAGRFAPAT